MHPFTVSPPSFKRISVFALTFLFLLITYFLLIVPKIHAVDPSYCDNASPYPAKEAIDNINKCAIEKDIYDDKLFNLNQITGTSDSLFTLLTGKSQLHPETDNSTQGGGALLITSKAVAMLYSSPPVSGVSFMAHEFRKINPVQPSYAADGGIGFNALEPVLPIWTVFRNAAYVAFVIIFVIIGFMVMFRAHISPQAVATVQDSIPRLVIALILVTFSYAIAGFMIDIMFLFLNIAINLLQSTGLLGTAGEKVFTKSVFGVSWDIWDDVVGSVAVAMADLLDNILDLGVLSKIIGYIGGTITGIIAAIALLFVMVRVFIMLLMAYVTIIILTMFAPFFFLIQALPGQNGAKEWFKQMAANVAIFPTVALMFIFAAMLGGLKGLGGGDTALLSGGNVGQFPLFSGDIGTEAVSRLIGLGFLMMTPEAGNLVKNYIGAKGPNLGGGAMAGMAAGAGVAAGMGKRGWAGAQNATPPGYNAQTGQESSGIGRYVSPGYWKTRGQVKQAEGQVRAERSAKTRLQVAQIEEARGN